MYGARLAASRANAGPGEAVGLRYPNTPYRNTNETDARSNDHAINPPTIRSVPGPVTRDGQGGIPVDVTNPNGDMGPLDHRREQTLTHSRLLLHPPTPLSFPTKRQRKTEANAPKICGGLYCANWLPWEPIRGAHPRNFHNQGI
jgi:hypothetical protein